MTINCCGYLIDLRQPKIMGILNVTPNSFFDGSFYATEKEILQQAQKMLEDGATFIDIGGYSTKPNAEEVSETEELQRVLPVVKLVLQHFPGAIISVDTFRSGVAAACLEAGAAMINDVSGGSLDAKMMETVASFGVPYIMMHLRGTPKTMQSLTTYENVSRDVLYYFSEKIALARSHGISDIIVDPGFGFAKTLEQNYELFQDLELFKILELPLLVGVSRKSMVYKFLKTSPQNALNGSTVLHTLALTKGATILRVHDVKEAAECIALMGKAF